MFAALRELSQRFAMRLRSRYTRSLEDEIARLRAENHALVNSILGVAGIPPTRAASAVTHTSASLSQAAGGQPSSVGATLGLPGRGKPRPYQCGVGNSEISTPSVPLRKRSWQQIGRLREIEDARAARRERESDTNTFPTPRSLVVRKPVEREPDADGSETQGFSGD